jgi:hypothetical protein
VSASTQRRGKHAGLRWPTLEEYIRHAERFGVDCVYETAEETGLIELGYLARHLRRIDRRWRLSSVQRSRLIGELLASGLTHRDIADMAGVSTDTVGRASAQLRHSGLQNRTVEPRKGRRSRGYSPLPVLVENADLRGGGRRGRP